MAKTKARPQTRRRALGGLQEQARIKRGNDTIVRVCMIAFGVTIALIAPVPRGWKITLFLAVMFLVGIVMPKVSRALRNPG